MISEESRKRAGNRIPPSGVEVASATGGHDEVPCRSCGKLIVWMKTKNGKNMPVNAETAKFGDRLFDQSKGHVSHFSDCPNAKEGINQDVSPDFRPK